MTVRLFEKNMSKRAPKGQVQPPDIDHGPFPSEVEAGAAAQALVNAYVKKNGIRNVPHFRIEKG